MKEEAVTIVDRDVLKVLSADTRMDILKMLKEGDRTPSFVAKKLQKSDSTIVEHLKTLEKVNLVKKTSAPGKKWVFYSLTERGKGIIAGRSRRLVIILSTSIILMMVGIGSMAGQLYPQSSYERLATTEDGRVPSDEVEQTLTTNKAVGTQDDSVFYISVAMIVLSAAGIGFYFYKKTTIGGKKI